jgi:AraC-like DNA-binding protein
LQFATQDPDEAWERFTEIYRPHRQTILSGHREFHASQMANGFPGLDLLNVCYGQSEVHISPVPFEDFLLVGHPCGGSFAIQTQGGEALQISNQSVVMDPYHTYPMYWGPGCRLHNIRLGRGKVERAAASIKGIDTPFRIHFGLGTPTAQAQRAWNSIVSALWRDIVPGGIADNSPLIRTQVLNLVVAALLEIFPNSLESVEPVEAGFAAPAAVRRAMAYIEQAAGEDIGLDEISSVARLSPRALQAAFRRHRDTTPLAYLRAVRLRNAHADLREADPDGTVTVSDIAHRWGFGNLSRFAEQHRKVYGSAPSEVLRQS